MEILFQNKNKSRVKECNSEVEQLPSTHKVLGSIPNAEKKNQSTTKTKQSLWYSIFSLKINWLSGSWLIQKKKKKKKNQLVFSKVGSLTVFGSVIGKTILHFLLALQAWTGNVCRTLLHRCKDHLGPQSTLTTGWRFPVQTHSSTRQGKHASEKALKTQSKCRAYWTQYPLMDGLSSSHKQMHASPITGTLASDSEEKVRRFPRPRPCEVW